MNSTKANELCMFDEAAGCNSCVLKNKLDCHFNLFKLLRFILWFFLIIITGSLALILNEFIMEFIIFLILLITFSIIFFEFWEIRILCSHCPFYAEEEKTLKCYGNYGSLKLWKYHPEPMSQSEKIQLYVGFLILFNIILLPSIILFWNQLILWGFIPVPFFILFLVNIKLKHCSRCPNFSCPFNSVAEEEVNLFLSKNPIMKEAWKDSTLNKKID